MQKILFSSLASPHPQTIKELQKGCWVRIENPNETEVSQLVDQLGVDQDLVTDALDPYEIPRLETVGPNTYFIIRAPMLDESQGDFTTPIMFIVHKDCVVTVCHDSLGSLWQPLVEKVPIATTMQSQLVLLLLERVVVEYQQKVAAINRQLRVAIRKFTSLRSEDIAVFVEYERQLNDFLDALLPTNEVVERLLGGKLKKFDEDKDLVEDLSIELEQVIARCKSLLRTITNVRDSFRAVMDTRLNETIRLLTVITLALTIPTMISGLYGMNVKLPGDESHPMTFWIIALIAGAMSAALAWYFLRRRD
ncbi:magnesium transporter CorA family protein [bacterium]|nr:magnesium transporter CorA family protein [bacterium]